MASLTWWRCVFPDVKNSVCHHWWDAFTEACGNPKYPLKLDETTLTCILGVQYPAACPPFIDDTALISLHLFLDAVSAEQLVRATGVWLVLPQQYTINLYQEQQCSEWITHLSDVFSFGICFKLTIAARNTNTTDDGAALKAQRYNNRVSGLRALQTLASFYSRITSMETHNPPPPQLPPACAILPTATLDKIIRWLADMLSIFLSWLRVCLVGFLTDRCIEWGFYIYIFWVLCFFSVHRSSAPVCERASRGKWEERRAH